MNVIRFMESFLPQVSDEDDSWPTRAKFFIFSMFFLGCFGSVYNIVYFVVGNPIGGCSILAEALFVWFLPFHFRRNGSLKHCVTLFCISFMLLMSTLVLTSGGATYSAIPWYGLIPVFTNLVTGFKSGVRWMKIVMGWLALIYVAELAGVVFPNYLQNPDRQGWIHFLHWFHYFGVILILTITSFVYSLINQQSQSAVKVLLHKAEEAGEHSENQSVYLADSVEKILKQMQRLAEGDLTASMSTKEQDEIGRLYAGFNAAVSRMHAAISEVAEAVDVTADASSHIESATGQLASGTKQQTDRAHEISESVHKIVDSIMANADSAQNSSEAARKNGRVAREGGEIVNQTVRKIDEIATVVDESAKSIKLLAASSNQIGQIVGVIKDIAGKTNLLALNATIEAARAGEAGKGFAVIAVEVKELAEKTSHATGEITKMINTVQVETQDVIRAMATGSDQVREGKQLAGRAGEALAEIVQSSANVTDMVHHIAEACQDQSRQSEHFFKRIEGMQALTLSGADEIREIASSTERLGELTARLQSELTRFTIRRGGATGIS